MRKVARERDIDLRVVHGSGPGGRIVARDLASYSRLMNEQLLGHGDVASVRSSVVLDRIKHTTSLPLPPVTG